MNNGQLKLTYLVQRRGCLFVLNEVYKVFNSYYRALAKLTMINWYFVVLKITRTDIKHRFCFNVECESDFANLQG